MQTREFFIAGVKFHDLHKVINEITEGDEFDLVAEPTNKYDSNAVQLIFNRTMCGYVPKTFSSEISAALDTYGSECLLCEVVSVNPKAAPWEQVKVKVSLDASLFPDAEDEDEDDFDEDIEEDEED